MACTSAVVSALLPSTAVLFKALLMDARLAAVTPVTPAVPYVAALGVASMALLFCAAVLMAFNAAATSWSLYSGVVVLGSLPVTPVIGVAALATTAFLALMVVTAPSAKISLSNWLTVPVDTVTDSLLAPTWRVNCSLVPPASTVLV